jgi:hypothetical protein
MGTTTRATAASSSCSKTRWGALVRRARVRAQGVAWHEHAASPGASFVVTLRDGDTELGGLHPGNAATLEVLYEHERAGR